MDPTPVLTQVDLPGIAVFRRGKVRDVLDLGDHLLLVATDRISAFDLVLPQGVPGKGQVLTQLSRFWFERLAKVVPNHCVTTDVARFPAVLQPHARLLEGRAMLCRKAEALPVECVVRGYLAGSGFKEYQERGSVSGIPLPPGLQQSERLPAPIFTPSTKAEVGHDENISMAEMAERIGKKLAEDLERISIQLYSEAARYALERGIIIADTKFEFGLEGGKVVWIDEALTPDSSRFWPASDYRAGISPPSYDKQFVRDWLLSVHWNKQPPAPALPPEIVAGTAKKYQEILAILTR